MAPEPIRFLGLGMDKSAGNCCLMPPPLGLDVRFIYWGHQFNMDDVMRSLDGLKRSFYYNLRMGLDMSIKRVDSLNNELKDDVMDYWFTNWTSGFSMIRRSILLLKIINYKEHMNYISSDNDIIVLRMSYMDEFDEIDRVLKKVNIPEMFLNRWLKRKIGKKTYKKLINNWDRR